MSEDPQNRQTSRVRIYQLLVRTFGNDRPSPRTGGSRAENGCGTFGSIDGPVLSGLHDMGFTHVWLTGVADHACGTGHPGKPADDPRLLKGLAGSPYAVRDWFDVAPDLAEDPEQRIEEFRALVDRCHAHGLRVLVDFIPNHVARSYRSDRRPELSFGRDDDPSVFFSATNHFYYLPTGAPGGGPPLKLPGCGESTYLPEAVHGRVTGNNAVTWAPGAGDWYETVKLNYGHDFTTGRDTAHLPGPQAEEVPPVWRIMNEVLAWWQSLGVDGFRADMAHMVPLPFWAWALRRARLRDNSCFFCAEAYDGDPAKLTDGDVLEDLLAAGFDAVYDGPSHHTAMGIHDSGKWANDLDPPGFPGAMFHRLLRYVENHDEPRVASPLAWGGAGMEAGYCAAVSLFAMGCGPVLVYQGQEVGETASGHAGYAGEGSRSTIFDYWNVPALVSWRAGTLDAGRIALRERYGRLLRLLGEPASATGGFHGLNHFNRGNPQFGNWRNDPCAGHWIHAYLRHDPETRQTWLVLANFHRHETWSGGTVRIPESARQWAGLSECRQIDMQERLHDDWQARAESPAGPLELTVPDLPPCTARVMNLRPA